MFLKSLFALFVIESGIKSLLIKKMLSTSQEVWYPIKLLHIKNNIMDFGRFEILVFLSE